VETIEQAAWDQRYSGPDLVWHGGPQDPDRLYTPAMITAEITRGRCGRLWRD